MKNYLKIGSSLLLLSFVVASFSPVKADTDTGNSFLDVLSQIMTQNQSSYSQYQTPQDMFRDFVAQHPEFAKEHPDFYNKMMGNTQDFSSWDNYKKWTYGRYNSYTYNDYLRDHPNFVRKHPQKAEYFRKNPKAADQFVRDWRNNQINEYEGKWKNSQNALRDRYKDTNKYMQDNYKKWSYQNYRNYTYNDYLKDNPDFAKKHPQRAEYFRKNPKEADKFVKKWKDDQVQQYKGNLNSKKDLLRERYLDNNNPYRRY